ncbi:DUF4236 domain-containing protein [Sporosarcina sp. BI001-red]|uniref:DUF4236 domain-containing protein n=1 Tax=Sporosarcina sp. BI001-red TaxID=2282866 RepID=UPI000E260E71|nr:DUF4236 domain-containing protein [Sporosarcina sp. BI001-red]REB05173.1 DUF4236 domain-containing protein [Sporosarcina sp. BI001-red]
MAFRFLRKVKSAQDRSLNFSKSDVSTSLGRRQAYVTVGKKGIRADAGIPGTGLFYSEQLSLDGSAHSQPSASQSASQSEIVNEIKAYNEYIHLLRSVHLDTKEPVKWEQIQQEDLSYLTENGPNAEKVAREFTAYEPTWKDQLFHRVEAKREELAEQLNEAIFQDQQLLAEKEKLKDLATQVLLHNESAWLEALDTYHAFESIAEFGNTVYVQFLNDELTISLDIGSEKVVPTEVLYLTTKGKLAQKKMGNTNYYALYQEYVCSCVIGIARIVFAILPAERVLIHAYDFNQGGKPPTKGCIVSAQITQVELADVLFNLIDCSSTIKGFQHNMKHLRTKGFRLVKELK